MDIGSSIPNGLNNEINDTASLYGTMKGGGINPLGGISAQSTLSRKSGKEQLIDN